MSLSLATRDALACIREQQTNIYLGARYGLTPQTYISPQQAGILLGGRVEKDFHEPFCDVAHRLGNNSGKPRLVQRFSDHYRELEKLAPAALEELSLLQPFSAGKVLVTSSYSTHLVSSFDSVSIADDEASVPNIRPTATSPKTFLVLLHGQQAKPNEALLTKHEIANYEKNRPALTTLLRGLLKENPWIVLGFEQAADATFSRFCWEVSEGLGNFQRRIYVVDPRDLDFLEMEWPKEPLKHIKMEPLDFLRLLTAMDEPTPEPKQAPGEPPAPTDSRPGPGVSDEGDATGPGESPPPSTSAANPGRAAPPPTIELSVGALDGRLYRVQAPSNLRISTLASQFIRRHVHGDPSDAPSRRERAVVDVERNGTTHRCKPDDTLTEAGLENGDRVTITTEAVAGTIDPRRREAYLNDVQIRLEELARKDNRIEVKPNLPLASDRYELILSCGGWGPPESTAQKPYRTAEQKILLDYPAEAPDKAPFVFWKSPSFHPNIHPKNGFVCLGALQESFTPLFGPVELVRMLIDLSEYRNYELKGVLNRDAAIWAQLNPDLLVEQGGWAYQPTLEDEADDEVPQLVFEDLGTGVGLRRRRKS